MSSYEEVSAFYGAYQGKKTIYGRSECGRNLYAFFAGCPCRPIGLVQGGIHAREHITAKLVLEQIKEGLCRGGAWFLPLTNPDGAELCERGVRTVEGKWRRRNLLDVNGSDDFSLWKANANCVDLNVNFDAGWGRGKRNVRIPAPENYIGVAPFCERETAALRDFTLKVCPDFTVSYHTKGEVIFWRYGERGFTGNRRLACALSCETGYPLADGKGSAGGYKDWCIEKLHIPSFTVEVGSDKEKHPLTEKSLPDILERNLCSIRRLTEEF